MLFCDLLKFQGSLCLEIEFRPTCNLQRPGDTDLQGRVWAKTPGALAQSSCGPVEQKTSLGIWKALQCFGVGCCLAEWPSITDFSLCSSLTCDEEDIMLDVLPEQYPPVIACGFIFKTNTEHRLYSFKDVVWYHEFRWIACCWNSSGFHAFLAVGVF